VIVKVQGVFERNKGALLMLEAIRDRLARDLPEARIAVPTSVSASYRRRHKLLGVLPEKGRKTKLLRFVPQGLLMRRGLVLPQHVDVLLDSSGFGYGDFWGLDKLRARLLGALKRWKQPGRVAVLLPQALGPFDAPGMKAAFAESLDLLDLAFVRDAQSMAHVEAAAPGHSRVRAAPDFTNLLHPPLKAEFANLVGHSFVIPNEKMVSGDRGSQRSAYVRAMAIAVEAIRNSGRTVDLLVHEGAPDRELAEEINAALSKPVELVDLPSPLDTKAAIASAELIVSSRFHGLVSALSNAVPALAVGWSHKYNELMADYGARELSVELDEEEAWRGHVAALLEAAGSPGFRATLAEAAEEQRGRSEAMWEETITTIRSARR
jgi:colanic acid/amylovoran biosynthesis protein